jgi:hypothetical protein
MRKFFAKVFVADPVIRAKQTYLGRDRFAHEAFQRGGFHVADNSGDDVPLALHGSDDNSLTSSASPAFAAALVFVTVLGKTADECFVHFHNAHKFLKLLIDKRRANAVAHVPSGFQRSEAHVAPDLACAHSLLASQHEMDDAEPVTKIDLRVLENCSGYVGETISAALAAIRAFPVPFAGGQRIDFLAAAARAFDAIWPAMHDQIGVACVFVGKCRLKLADCHLVDLFRLLCAGYEGLPRLLGEAWHENPIRQVGEHPLNSCPQRIAMMLLRLGGMYSDEYPRGEGKEALLEFCLRSRILSFLKNSEPE